MEKRKPSENVTDDWNIKYVKVGDAFECEECGEEGVFDLDRQLEGAIAPSEYILEADDVSRLSVCAACEEERQKLARGEYKATLCLWECEACERER